ncbi:helix-turn-helix transcriptional regulator [Myceligenerans xiligouense]|uniref:DNA-binding NarL/FixJ family response regulator n=1 Tax=Myceligenerans xiligouense TaxID=253184 RepID=A0A3N4Z1T1_9MICO|nr:LuxR C-terminal-related transcriptional regulator [Myceligenerans xiligouense]RPF19988.1 DNA-binding NarL/FixJ family response regulator [Myceligenerans xiligouense]
MPSRVTVGVLSSSLVLRRGLLSLLGEAACVSSVIVLDEDDVLRPECADIVVTTVRDLGSIPLDGAKRVLVALPSAPDVSDCFRCDRVPDGYFLLQEVSARQLDAAIGDCLIGRFPAPREVVRELAARAHVEVPVARTPVTSREIDTLKLMASGLSNDQIAARLGITRHGVKRLVSSTMLKLGASNRTSAVMRAIEMGIIQYPWQTRIKHSAGRVS